MRKIFNSRFSMFNTWSLLIIFFTLHNQTYANTNNFPINHYTNFTILNKSQNSINIESKISDIHNSEIQSKLIEEFKNSNNSVIYHSRLIALPENGNVEINIHNIDSVITPITDDIIISNNYDNLPIAYLDKPGIMRDLKVALLAIRQYRYNPLNKTIISYNKVNIELTSTSNIFNNDVSVSETWNNFYKNSVLNYEDNTDNLPELGLPQGYLIIVADALYDNILPFAQWKNLKGFSVTVKRLSEVGGNDPTIIKSFIKQAYETWSPRLEYVLIVGSGSLIRGVQIPPTANVGDHLYACVSGDDLYPDLFVGRFPAASTSELSVMLAKTLGYEKTPYLNDTLWYRKALMVGTTHSTGQPVWTALTTLRWTRNLFLQHQFLQVDTVFDPPNQSGVGLIDTFVNRGVAFVNGRGWGNYQGWHYPQFYSNNVNNLNNGWKLPIVTSFYCGTGNYAGTQRCFGETWLIAGTPTNPKGGVAFYGPTYANTSSRFNNCHNYGVYWGILEEGINICGPAMFRGKLEMLSNFLMPADSEYLYIHTCTYNLLGDPSLEMWTGEVPKSITANYLSEIPVGSSSFNVSVSNAASQPIPGALVSLYKAGEIKTTTYTDNSGNASFNFTTQTQDTLFVTVTKHNYAPHLGNVRITTQPVYVGYYNNSGNVIAGQTTNLSVTLKNYGSSQTASNTIVSLRTQNNQVTILDSVKSYGNIGPNQTAVNTFQFSVATNCTNNHRINFQLHIVSGSNTWEGLFSVLARSPELVYYGHTVNDGSNQILDPGETANLLIKIFNKGSENINNVTGTLRCANPWAIRVLDSTSVFGNISAGDSIQNTLDYFSIQSAQDIAIGHKFYFQLILSNSSGYQRILEFPITVGTITSNAPVGPDAYGYYAYDNTDFAYNEHPVYSWVEIDPNFGSSGTRIPLSNDAIRVINLPFTFRYYGRNFNRISVCSNGYIAMDSSWIVDQYNWRIPSPFGPPTMIALFWDDFHPDTLGASGVYYYYDSPNNRFIIEWSRVRHIHGFRDPSIAEQQTFQIILYNQAYYHTRTNDGPILFQYQTVFNDDSLPSDCHNYATVGIENFEQTVGIEYSYAGRYPSAAAQLENSRAIKFTTNLPDTFTAISEQKSELGFRIEGIKIAALPNPFKSLTTVRYTIPIHGDITIGMYDINGKLIRQLLSENKSPGIYQIQLSRKNLPTGIYFVVLTLQNTNDKISENTKIVLY